ncbi:MAG: uncharacterized protein A8A55_2595 [Amphiamblys sp. WSBS2006]|nr:MAG: uncharacterized protein A8A55_2595 [Amphiamblys sp. WSBS2006]
MNVFSLISLLRTAPVYDEEYYLVYYNKKTVCVEKETIKHVLEQKTNTVTLSELLKIRNTTKAINNFFFLNTKDNPKFVRICRNDHFLQEKNYYRLREEQKEKCPFCGGSILPDLLKNDSTTPHKFFLKLCAHAETKPLKEMTTKTQIPKIFSLTLDDLSVATDSAAEPIKALCKEAIRLCIQTETKKTHLREYTLKKMEGRKVLLRELVFLELLHSLRNSFVRDIEPSTLAWKKEKMREWGKEHFTLYAPAARKKCVCGSPRIFLAETKSTALLRSFLDLKTTLPKDKKDALMKFFSHEKTPFVLLAARNVSLLCSPGFVLEKGENVFVVGDTESSLVLDKEVSTLRLSSIQNTCKVLRVVRGEVEKTSPFSAIRELYVFRSKQKAAEKMTVFEDPDFFDTNHPLCEMDYSLFPKLHRIHAWFDHDIEEDFAKAFFRESKDIVVVFMRFENTKHCFDPVLKISTWLPYNEKLEFCCVEDTARKFKFEFSRKKCIIEKLSFYLQDFPDPKLFRDNHSLNGYLNKNLAINNSKIELIDYGFLLCRLPDEEKMLDIRNKGNLRLWFLQEDRGREFRVSSRMKATDPKKKFWNCPGLVPFWEDSDDEAIKKEACMKKRPSWYRVAPDTEGTGMKDLPEKRIPVQWPPEKETEIRNTIALEDHTGLVSLPEFKNTVVSRPMHMAINGLPLNLTHYRIV